MLCNKRNELLMDGWDLAESSGNYAEWEKKPIPKTCVLYNSAYKTFLK